METLGYMIGMVALIWCISLSTKVSKMERIIREAGIINTDKTSLSEILVKHIGKIGKIQFENNAEDYEIMSKNCKLIDIDEDWLLVKTEKGNIDKLIRIESIKNIQFMR